MSLAAVMGLVVEKMRKNLSASLGLRIAFDLILEDFLKISFAKTIYEINYFGILVNSSRCERR